MKAATFKLFIFEHKVSSSCLYCHSDIAYSWDYTGTWWQRWQLRVGWRESKKKVCQKHHDPFKSDNVLTRMLDPKLKKLHKTRIFPVLLDSTHMKIAPAHLWRAESILMEGIHTSPISISTLKQQQLYASHLTSYLLHWQDFLGCKRWCCWSQKPTQHKVVWPWLP